MNSNITKYWRPTMIYRILIASLLGMVVCLTPLFAADSPLDGFTIKGKAYLDYSYLLSDDGPMAESKGDGWNAFKFRRAYFTLEHKFGDNFKVRFRTDADRKADDKLRVFVKHIYLEWSNLVPNSKLYIGQAATPTKEHTEAVWGLRGLEKTLMDVYKDQTGQGVDFSSADVGVALKGNIVKQLKYYVMVSNGSGYSHPEGDKYKKFAGQIQVIPTDGFTIAYYGDTEKQNTESTNYTNKVDVTYKNDKGAIGFEFFRYTDNANALKRSGLSFYGSYQAAKEIKLFARYDRYDPFIDDESNTQNDEINYFIGGFDYSPHKLVHVMPNLRVKSYANDDSSDVWALVTFELKY